MGICISRGKQPANGLMPLSLYRASVASDCALESFLYFSLICLILGLSWLSFFWDLIDLTVKGRKTSLMITVRTTIARPKSFQGKMLYKNTVTLKSGLNKISLKILIMAGPGLLGRGDYIVKFLILLFRTLSGDRVFRSLGQYIQNRSGGICSSNRAQKGCRAKTRRNCFYRCQ